MKTIRVNNNVEIFWKHQADQCVFVRRGTGETFEFDLDSSGKALIEKTASQNIPLFYEELTPELKDCSDLLLSLGLLTNAPVPNPTHPYRSQFEAFRNWELDPESSQKNINQLRIGLIGVGGLGGWLALELAALGIRNFVLVDSDRVDQTNLVRQPYNRSDIGAFKVDAITTALELRFDDLQVKKIYEMADAASPFDDWFSNCDIILVAGDFPSRSDLAKTVSSWCMEREKTHLICGGYSGHNSAMGITVIPGKTPCWSCYEKSYFTQQPSLVRPENRYFSGPKNPAGIVPTVLIAASASVYEVLQLALGRAPLFAGRCIDFNASQWSLEAKPFSASADCSHCHHLQVN